MDKEKLLFELDKFRASIFPDRCCFCDKAIHHNTELCPDCRKNAKKITGSRCLSCGMSKKECSCKSKANFYDGITAPYIYQDIVRNGIIRWKYHEAEQSIHFFAKEIADCVKSDFDRIKFDAVTFIPQTKNELMEKGQNQSELLAVEVAKKLNLPSAKLIVKIFETSRQHDLPWHLRSGNVFGAFGCPDKSAVKGKTVLLVDDIKTSGRTLNECAKVLQLNDAENVYCAVIAIAQNPNRKPKKVLN